MSDNFFYDLNKRLQQVVDTPKSEHKQLNEGANSKAVAEDFGATAAIAGGAALGSALGAVKGRYDDLKQRERGATAYTPDSEIDKPRTTMQRVRAAAGFPSKNDPNVKTDEGMLDSLKQGMSKAGKVAKKVGGKVLDKLGHGSDEDMIRDLQKKAGVPQTGKKPMATPKESVESDVYFGDDAYIDIIQDMVDNNRRNMSPSRKLRVLAAAKRIVNSEGGQFDPQKFEDAYERVMNFSRDMHEGVAEDGVDKAAFAKLAPPKDKITFADKIAGAKKEVDEMLGDVAADAIKKAVTSKGGKVTAGKGVTKHHAGPGVYGGSEPDVHPLDRIKGPSKKQLTGKQETDEGSDWKDLGKEYSRPKVGSVTHGHKHDIEHTATGQRVTRRTDPNTGHSVGAEDDAPAAGEKRGRGRPKGTGKSMGAKGPSGKSKLMTKEADHDQGDVKAAVALLKKAGYKVTKAEQELDEKAVSKKQQKFMGMVHATQKGEKAPSKEVAKVAKTMKKSDAEDFAATKHKGLPEKKKPEAKKDSKSEAPKKKKTEEAGGSGTPTASSGFSYGKGIYDSLNREIENLIAESMQNEDAPRSWQQAADTVGTLGGAALGAAGGGLVGALMGSHVFGPLGMAAGAGVGGLAGLKGGAAMGGGLAKSAVNTAHDAGVGLYRKISSMLGGPEGTIAFAKAHIKAAAANQDSFEFDGKNYSVTMDRNEATQLWRNLGKDNTSGTYDQLGYPVRPGVPRNRGLVRESMSINMSDSTEGGKSLTITATDDDAMKLAEIIRNAGIGGAAPEAGEVEVVGIDSPISGDEGHDHGEPCETCGSADCGCGDVEEALAENEPDWPTDEVVSDDALQYSGGLNKPKTTVAGDGQTTVPVTAVQVRESEEQYKRDLRKLLESAGIEVTDEMLEEGWKEKLGAAGLAGAMALGSLGAGAAQAAPQQGIDAPTAATQQQKQDVWQPAYQRAYALYLATKNPDLKQELQRLNQSHMDQSHGVRLMVAQNKNLAPKAAQEQKQLDLKYKTDLEQLLQRYNANESVQEQEQVMAPEEIEEAKEMCEVCEATPCKCDESVEESIARFRRLAGIQETKKVEEDDVEEGNKFTGNLAKARAAGAKEADLDGDGDMEKVRESVNKMTNLWKAYKG